MASQLMTQAATSEMEESDADSSTYNFDLADCEMLFRLHPRHSLDSLFAEDGHPTSESWRQLLSDEFCEFIDTDNV